MPRTAALAILLLTALTSPPAASNAISPREQPRLRFETGVYPSPQRQRTLRRKHRPPAPVFPRPGAPSAGASTGFAPYQVAHLVPQSAPDEDDHARRAADPGRAFVDAAEPAELVSVLSIRGMPVLVDDGGVLQQPIYIAVSNATGEVVAGEIHVSGSEPETVSFEAGTHTLKFYVPAVDRPVSVTVTVVAAEQTVAEQIELLEPVRRWEVHLLCHSHVDIGFSALQSEVEKKQWSYIERGIRAAHETAAYPAGARFKWNVEVLWAVDGYLAQATERERDAFLDAAFRGVLGLDALYDNALTGLHNQEELVHLLDYARELSRRYDLHINSAMISDLPGYTWGMVPILADSGVEYLSIGANRSNEYVDAREGNFYSTWSDRPFYWVSPSGERRVLTWISGSGYHAFALAPIRELDRLLGKLSDLQAAGYPYDITYFRYVIFDNLGPDEPISDVVRAWNESHLAPRLLLSTTREVFEAFEERYGDGLPSVSGSLTPYWEDGAASSARETGLNRVSSERLIQAERLWAMLAPDDYPVEKFRAGWRNALLFDEHTWGSALSVVDPGHPSVPEQWAVKQAFALDADRISRELLDGASEARRVAADGVAAVQVFNTSSWPRTDLVLIPADWALPGDRVQTTAGEAVASQRLASGELAFIAAAVPAFGASAFTFHNAPPLTTGSAGASGSTLSDGSVTLALDSHSGAIVGLFSPHWTSNLVDTREGLGLNDYVYVAGRDPANAAGTEPVSIGVLDAGPLVASLRVESGAPGSNRVIREFRVVSGLGRVDITNVIDKLEIFEPESLHLAFPWNIEGGRIRIDIPWAVLEPDVNQIDGSNRNHFPVQRWVDVSNEAHGVTWTSRDAPLCELGAITNDAPVVGWVDQIVDGTVVYSYAMNNYWWTNFRAAQSGPTLFRYSIEPHGPYEPAQTQRRGEERAQPLVVVPVALRQARSEASRLRIMPTDVLASTLKPSDDGEALVVRLFGASGEARRATLEWGGPGAIDTYESNLGEDQCALVEGPVDVPGYGMVTLRLVPVPEPSATAQAIFALVTVVVAVGLLARRNRKVASQGMRR